MKKYIHLFIFLSLILNSSCKEDPISLPSEVELGTTLVYLNGEEVDYKLTVRISAAHNYLNVRFVEDLFPELIINTCGFTWMKIEEGVFDLHEKEELFVGALTSFSQGISEDVEGYSYKLINEKEGYLTIDKLDLTAGEIAGSFLAEFKRTKKNGNSNTGLPKKILIQGVFHEEF